MTPPRYLTRRNLVGIAMGAVIALSVGLAAVYEGLRSFRTAESAVVDYAAD